MNHGEHGGHGEKLGFQALLRIHPAGDWIIQHKLLIFRRVRCARRGYLLFLGLLGSAALEVVKTEAGQPQHGEINRGTKENKKRKSQ